MSFYNHITTVEIAERGALSAMLKAKRKSGSVKFLSNEKEYTILSLFLWVEGGEEV